MIKRLCVVVCCICLLIGSAQAQDFKDAIKYYDQGDYFNARKTVQALLKISPKHPTLLGFAGKIEFEMDEFDKALALVKQASELEDNWKEIDLRFRLRVNFHYGHDKVVKELLQKASPKFWEYQRIKTLVAPKAMDMKKSKNYLIYSSRGFPSQKTPEYVAKLLDAAFQTYSEIFPFTKKTKVKLRVYVFDKTEKYNSFNKMRLGKIFPVVGFFSPSTKILAINADPLKYRVNKFGLTKEAVDTLLHEGFHQYIDLHVQNIPRWLNEGLAEYFGPSVLGEDNKLKVGVVFKSREVNARIKDNEVKMTRYQQIRFALLRGYPVKVMSLREFMSPKNLKFGDGSQRSFVNYAQAWSFIHFLLHSQTMKQRGKQLIMSYFAALREGRTATAAYELTFAKLDLDKIDKAWREYVQKL